MPESYQHMAARFHARKQSEHAFNVWALIADGNSYRYEYVGEYWASNVKQARIAALNDRPASRLHVKYRDAEPIA